MASVPIPLASHAHVDGDQTMLFNFTSSSTYCSLDIGFDSVVANFYKHDPPPKPAALDGAKGSTTLVKSHIFPAGCGFKNEEM